MVSREFVILSIALATIAGEARAQSVATARRPDVVQAAAASDSAARQRALNDSLAADSTVTDSRFTSTADSIAWARHKAVADRAVGLHLVVSLKDRRLVAMLGPDTLLSTPVAVASGNTVEAAGRKFTFVMPRGVRTVRGKESNPIWQPPDWLYYETAAEFGLKVAAMKGKSHKLGDGRELEVRDSVVGLIRPGEEWAPLPTDEHLIFNGTVYIPPMGTINRRVNGVLGQYRLDLGEGFLLHGTPFKNSIGLAATHGCVRLRDEDILWLYENVPVGTKVYIY
jgi:hypothetical protein